MSKILVVEDDDAVAHTIVDGLTLEKHVAELVSDGQEAVDRLRIYEYDLLILDWGLPTLSGLEVCQTYRKSGGEAPILMLTGRSAVKDKAHGLDSGADDYLVKPFSMEEFTARVRALLRRANKIVKSVLTASDITLDLNLKQVFRGSEPIILVAKEYALLEFLMRNQGQLFSADDLLNKVWSSESDASADALRQCLLRLRKKIDLPGQPSVIKTRVGLGYTI